MMAAVPKAAVVITNPTHYAVALAYDRGTSARLASSPRAPMRWRRASATMARGSRACRSCRTRHWPAPCTSWNWRRKSRAEHYQAVAEIIAFVWRLNNRAGGARR